MDNGERCTVRDFRRRRSSEPSAEKRATSGEKSLTSVGCPYFLTNVTPRSRIRGSRNFTMPSRVTFSLQPFSLTTFVVADWNARTGGSTLPSSVVPPHIRGRRPRVAHRCFESHETKQRRHRRSLDRRVEQF